MSVYVMDRWEAAKYTFRIHFDQVPLTEPDGASAVAALHLLFLGRVPADKKWDMKMKHLSS